MKLCDIVLAEIFVASLIGVIESMTFLPLTKTCWRNKTIVEQNNCGFWSSATCRKELVEECCRGYRAQRIRYYAKCIPICISDCENGHCVAPDTCRCNQGYEKYANYGKCVPMPTCSNGCVNGRCIQPELCICEDGYEMVQNKCEPICTDGCQNGQCVEPNVCACNAGYKMEQNKCEPICLDGCKNGQCVEPNVCACNAGGYKMVANKCEPICSSGCQNGKCIEPELCSCIPGYKVKQDLCSLWDCGTIYCLFNTLCSTCEPVCTGCDDGTCVEPDNCICPDGFVYSVGGCSELNCTVNKSCIPIDDKTTTTSTNIESVSWSEGFWVASSSLQVNNTENMSSTSSALDENVVHIIGNASSELRSDTGNGHVKTDPRWIIFASSGAAAIILILILLIVIWKRSSNCSKGRYSINDKSADTNQAPVVVFSSAVKNEV